MPLRRRSSWGTNKPPVGWRPDELAVSDYGITSVQSFSENGGRTCYPLVNENVVPSTLIGGVSWIGSQSGPCLSLDGSSGYVLCDATQIKSTSQFSCTLYFNNQTSQAFPYLIDVFGDSTDGITVQLDSPSTAGYYVTLPGGATFKDLYTPTTLVIGQWYRLDVTYNGSAVQTYLNGVFKSSFTLSGALSWNASTTLSVGRNNKDNTLFFNGLIDHVVCYSKALPAEVIARAYVDPFWWMQSRRTTLLVGVSGILPDAASNSGYQAAASTYTWSHTCTGSNRYLGVDISILSVGGTVTSITYNGVAMSAVPNASISTVSSLGRIECWGLANPASGTNTISVTLSGSIASIGTAVSYTNVDQTVPTEAGNAAQATNVGAADATVSVTTITDQCWIHGAIVTNDTSITANQTTRNNVSQVAVGSGANEDSGPVSPGSTASSYTNVGAAQTWAMGAYGLRPSSSFYLFAQSCY